MGRRLCLTWCKDTSVLAAMRSIAERSATSAAIGSSTPVPDEKFRLKSRRIPFLPASFDLISVGANHRHAKMFRFSAVRIDTERFIGDLEGFPSVSKMSDDFGNIGIPAMGAINCTNNAYFIMMPMIFMMVSGRRAVPRLIIGLRIGAYRAQEGEQYR